MHVHVPTGYVAAAKPHLLPQSRMYILKFFAKASMVLASNAIYN